MKTSRFDKLIAGGAIFAIAFTALAHGAVEPWSIAIFEVLALLLMLLWAAKSVFEKQIEISIPKTFWPLAALLVLGLIQRFAFKNGTAGEISSFSVDREATSSVIKMLFFLLFMHLIAANFFNTKEKALALAKFLTIFGLVAAVFALLQYFTWNGNLYWFRPLRGGQASVTGPFVNHNHFAGFLELLIPIPIALLAAGTLKQNRIFYGFAAAMMSIAVLASLSRGGISSLICGLVFTFFIGFAYRKRQNRGIRPKRGLSAKPHALRQRLVESLSGLGVILAITGAIFIGIVWVGTDPVVDRLTNNALFSEDEKAPTFETSRGWIWQNSLKIFYSNPVLGAGLGAFETAYPKYSANNETFVIDRAHNDYLQVLTDTGIVGGILTLWFIGIFVLNVINLWRQDFDPLQAGIALGSAGGVFSLLIHSIFDFNLQIPSNALLFLVLAAVFSQAVSVKYPEVAVKAPVKSSENKGEEVLALGASA